MQFNPKIGFILGILVTIEIAISSGTVSLTNVVPAAYVSYVVGWCGLLAFMGSTILTFLHAYSSGAPGPLVSAPPAASPPAGPKAVPAIVLLIACAAILGLLCPGAAYAQGAPRPFKPTGNLANDIAATKGPATLPAASNGFEPIGQQLAKLAKDLVDKAIADVSAASVDATIRNDQIALPCWEAQISFFRLLPVEWVASPGTPAIPATATSPEIPAVPATPGPPADMGPALAFQVARDLMNAITGSDKGSLKVACAALLGDQLKVLNNLIGLVGIAGIAGLPVGL